MPAGVSVGVYIRFCVAAAACMATGSQIVHQMYEPLGDLNDYIEREISELPPEAQRRVRSRLGTAVHDNPYTNDVT